MTHLELLPEIFKLDPQEQYLLAEAIRRHLGGTGEPLDEAEFKRELERRMAEADEHPETLISHEELMARLRAGR